MRALSRTVRVSSLCVGAVMTSVLPGALEAQTRTAVDVMVGARAATNPYDAVGPDTGAVAVSLDVDPSLTIERELSTLALTGSARIDQYLSRYGTDFSGHANADYERRLSEAATIGASANFSTTRSGISDLLRNGIPTGSETIAPLPVDQQVIDVAGTPSRQNRYSFLVRANVRPSEFETMQASTGIALSDISSGQGDDYRQVFTNLAYIRALSPSTSVSARVGVSDVDYRGRSNGDGQIISPLVGVNLRLNPTITASLSAGVSISRIKQNDIRRSQTGLAAQASLCRRGELNNICLNGSRDTQPSSLGGVSRATSVGLSAERRLSPFSTLALFARYGRTDQPSASQTVFGFRRTEFVAASATLSQRLSERVSLVVSPGFDKVRDDDSRSRRTNFEIMGGIRVRFGQYR